MHLIRGLRTIDTVCRSGLGDLILWQSSPQQHIVGEERRGDVVHEVLNPVVIAKSIRHRLILLLAMLIKRREHR
jgi:hypothetical protein